jgi:hypothetical protein
MRGSQKCWNRQGEFPQSNGAIRNAWLDYTVHIHDQYGRAPALTPLGERLFHPSQPQFGGVQVNPFGPGQAATETLQLSALYVLEPHHYYSISLEFNKSVRFLTTPLRSNWITVSVK